MPPKKVPDPVISLGPVAAPTVRTGAQLLSGEFIMQGVELFLWEPSGEQRTWLVGLLTLAIAFSLNAVEKIKNRKLVGVSK